MSGEPPTPPAEKRPSSGQHLATISHEGRFWDVYLEFDEDLRRPGAYRGSLAFSPADRAEGEAVLRTAAVIIESSYEAALERAHGLESHQFAAFLRSVLP
jgi:D-serine deaminase-like pyridoxal phosphate-dependent protein